MAGLAFVMLPALCQAYLPTWTANVLPVIFGLGAISAAKFPDGVLAEQSRRLRHLLQRVAPDSVADDHFAEEVRTGVAETQAVVAWSPRVWRGTPRDGHRPPGRGRQAASPPGPHRPRSRRRKSPSASAGWWRSRRCRSRSQRGSIVGLVGPNGAGKSTLLPSCPGCSAPTAGTVRLQGEDVTGTSARHRATRGLARTFQQPELFMGLTVREHLVLAYRARVSPHRMWRDMLDPRALFRTTAGETDKVDGLLELLHLTHVAKAPVAALPLGVIRLVEVGRALAASPGSSCWTSRCRASTSTGRRI